MASSGNFCTLNPLAQPNSGTYSEGNLLFTHTASAWRTSFGTHGMRTGKWYWEAYQYEDITTGNGFPIGIYDQDSGKQAAQAAQYPGQSNSSYGTGYIAYSNTGTYATKRNNGSETNMTIDDGDAGDVWQCAFDADNGKIWFGKNNTWDNSANPALGSNESYASIPSSTWVPITCSYSDSSSENYPQNFGQDSTFSGRISAGGNADDNGFGDFKYAPPTGFLALCSGNLPISDDIDPAQTDDNYPGKNFNTVIYDSTGSGQNITGVGFQPDLVWVKCRSVAQGNGLFDSNRGTSKVLQSDATNAENTSSGLTSFDSDGYTMGTYYNQSGREFVGWCWKAGGTASSDASGDITVSRSTNDAAKFSILTYTGSGSSGNTIAHGLGVKPAMTIIKQRNSSNGWNVWHQGNNDGDYDSFGELNGTAAWYQNQGSNGPFSAAPGTDYLTLTAYGQVNGSSNTYVAYVWADVEGMQKFGKFEGNANNDGPFIYTGFRPKMLFIKSVDTVAPWVVWDTARSTFNKANNALAWNVSNTEADYTGYPIDILSNGFKLRTSNATVNASGTWVYGAWADVPFKYNNTF